MRISTGEGADQLTTGLDALASTDVVALDDQSLREQLRDLLAVANRVHAELARRVDVFDRRQLAEPDGFRTTKSWLQAFGRLSGQTAARTVAAARLLRRLPKLAMAAQCGDVPAEQVQQVSRLATQVGVDELAGAEATLTDAARSLDPSRFALVCARVQAHLDPDGRDPAADFDRRSLTMTAADGMMLLRGQLDAEGGAALATALDALMLPPGEDDPRGPGQRRADALAQLARQQLAAGTLPQVGGQRPQVGVLLHPQSLSPAALAALAAQHRDQAAGQRLRQLADPADSSGLDRTRPADRVPPSVDPTQLAPAQSPPARSQPAGPEPGWQAPGWADPPWLSWVGAIRPEVAQRIACDADIWRVVLDPARSP